MKRLATVFALGVALSMAALTLSEAQFYPYFAPEGGPAIYYEDGRYPTYSYGYGRGYRAYARRDFRYSRNYASSDSYGPRCHRRTYRTWSGAVVSRRQCY